MKRLLILTFVVAVTFAVAGTVTRTFDFARGRLDLGKSDAYTTVEYAGAPVVEPLGAPALPSVPCQVVIPADAEVTGIEVTVQAEEPVAGSYDVLPVQHPVPYAINAAPRPFVEPDPAWYGVNADYPKTAALLGRSGNRAGYRLVSFGVYPVRYNPSEHRLTFASRVSVRINYASGKRHVARHTDLQNELHGQAVSRLVLNPEDVGRFAPPRRGSSYGSAFLPAGDFEHVIIARAYWADTLQRLVDWRTRQGWRSKVMPLESICAVYPGRDTAEKMRNFIKDADTTWGTIFVFIARDDYPAKQYRVAKAYNYDMYSDMYFSDLDGTWDFNNNNIFGEVADSVDCYADVFVGMITLNGYTELRNYLDKLFRYEFTPDTVYQWTTKMLLPNGVTFSNQYNDSVANATPTPPWYDLKMYSSGGMVTPSAQKYCDSLNSGYSMSSIIAHGSPDIFQLGGNVTSAMMNGLTNTDRMDFGTYVCCNTGEWNLGSTNGDCIAENMVFHAPAGHIGVCMNYESGWVACAELFNYSIMYGAVGWRTSRRVTMAEALSYGKDYWAWCYKDSAKWRMEAFERNLFGEPAVPIWSGDIFTASVTKPGAINIGTNIPVNITVKNGATAVESALVCLRKGNETFGRGWTDASGAITLLMSPLTPGQMQLTITCANNIPYLDSITVMSSGKYVSYLRHSISDPGPGGNGDGVINPGESFRIPTWLKNFGTQAANGVTGRLITHAAGATVTDPQKTFGNIPAGDSVQNTEGFGMTVANGLPNGYAIPCSVVCRDNVDSVWVSYVTFTVGAPNLVFVDKTIRDEGGSRPNGKLDPGETAELEVTVRNSGGGTAANARAVLRSGDSRLTVPDSTATYGAILKDSTKTNTTDRFAVTAQSGIVPGTTIPCTLYLYADAGYTGVQVFSLVVGEQWAIDPIPDGPRQPPLYWAFDDKDTTYDQHPTYSWVEIKASGTRLNYSNNDAVIVVTLPSEFGPLKYYGQRYTQISVSADGWIAPGNYTTTNFTNTALPSTSAPPGAICGGWDDLYPGYGSAGYAYYYHDAANHRFVVEFDSCSYYGSTSNKDKFEFVFYDTTLAGPSGNSDFVLQYMTANYFSGNTIGIQDPTRAIGIQCLFDGARHNGCYQLGPQRAIRFTTDEPTGISEPVTPTRLAGRALAVAPSLFARTTMVHWNLPVAGNAELAVFDATGRLVRTLASGYAAAGAHQAAWDARDNRGRALARGIYFVRLTTDKTVQVKTVLAE